MPKGYGYERGSDRRHGGRGYGYAGERDNHGEYGVHGGYSKHGGYGPYSGAGVYGMHAGWGMFGEPPHSHDEYIEDTEHATAGMGRHGGRRFQRRYWGKSEVLDDLRSYLSDLHAEISAVEEHIARMEQSRD